MTDQSMKFAMERILERPLDSDSRMGESWQDRWERLFGYDPGMRTPKRLSNTKEPRPRDYKRYK